MWSLVDLQYDISKMTLEFISDHILPLYYTYFDSQLGLLIPEHFKLSEIDGILFITTFILSIIVFLLGKLIGKILGFKIYNAEQYRLMLFFNIFYIVPFIYGFLGGKMNIINLVFLFIGSGAYFLFDYIVQNPAAFIDYFEYRGISL